MAQPVEFDGFCKAYLEQWEQRATVRRRSRSRFSAEAVDSEMFPAAMIPILKHEAVAGLGPEAARSVQIQSACEFLLHVAILEVQIISDLCNKLANDGMGAPLPESARQVALTIATDESYHAFVAREFLSDVERLTGIAVPPVEGSELTVSAALRALQKEAPAGLRRATETMALCFAENSITEELFGLSKEADPTSFFHLLVREHMMDEGRHQIFFQRLFRHLWWGIGEPQRVALGRLIPFYLETYLSHGFASFNQSTLARLATLGFDGETGQRIFDEASVAAFGTERPPKHKLILMRSPLSLVDVAGVLEHEPTRRLMIEQEWAEA